MESEWLFHNFWELVEWHEIVEIRFSLPFLCSWVCARVDGYARCKLLLLQICAFLCILNGFSPYVCYFLQVIDSKWMTLELNDCLFLWLLLFYYKYKIHNSFHQRPMRIKKENEKKVEKKNEKHKKNPIKIFNSS